MAAAGVAHIPEDRLATGLAGGIDVETNATLRHYRNAPLSKGPVLMRKAMGAFADRLIAEHDVKTPSRRARVRQLSGGNQQKLIIARELAGCPAVIIASYANPRRRHRRDRGHPPPAPLPPGSRRGHCPDLRGSG